jgi:hypothetical protein
MRDGREEQKAILTKLLQNEEKKKRIERERVAANWSVTDGNEIDACNNKNETSSCYVDTSE